MKTASQLDEELSASQCSQCALATLTGTEFFVELTAHCNLQSTTDANLCLCPCGSSLVNIIAKYQVR